MSAPSPSETPAGSALAPAGSRRCSLWTLPLGQLNAWSLNQKTCLIYMALLIYSVLYAVYHQWLIGLHSPFVDPAYSGIMVLEQLMLMSITLVLWRLTYQLRHLARAQMALAYLAMMFYSGSLIFQAYQVGLFTFPVGVVLAAGPMFTFTFLPFRVVYAATAAAVSLLVAVCVLVATGRLANAPLFLPGFWTDPAARPLLFGSMAYFALPHILTLMGLYDLTLRMRQRREQEIHRLSITDALTGLYNRRHVLAQLQALLGQEPAQTISVVLLDVDHFKHINDQHGHLVGDAVLREIAQAMQHNARSEDWIGRYGGEEFLWVLPGLSVQAAEAVARRHCQAVAGLCLEVGGAPLPLSASYGVCSTEQVLREADALLHAADLAMYQAKSAGRNRVQVYRPGQTATGP